MKNKIGILIFLFSFLYLPITGNDTTIHKVDTISVISDSVMIIDTLQIVSEYDSIQKAEEEKITPDSILEYISISKIFYSIIIFLLTYIFLKILSKILIIWAELNTKQRVTMKGLIPVIRIFAWTGAIFFIIAAILKPPMATILAFGASLGVAVGFASQDLLKNIFGGITIIFDRPFKVGDKVSIGNYYGEVVEIGLRSTRLVTPDDNLVSVPNGELMNQSVANANAGEDNCQVVTDLYLPLDADVDSIKPIAYEAAAVSPYIFLNKPIIILFAQETIGQRVVLRLRIKAYVNDTRKEFLFKSDITEILTKELYINQKIKHTHQP